MKVYVLVETDRWENDAIPSGVYVFTKEEVAKEFKAKMDQEKDARWLDDIVEVELDGALAGDTHRRWC